MYEKGKIRTGDKRVIHRIGRGNEEYSPPRNTVVTVLDAARGRVLVFAGRLSDASAQRKLENYKLIAGKLCWVSEGDLRPLQPDRGTQAFTVLDHLKRAPYITDSQASSLYGIGQCAGVVSSLRRMGHVIESTFRECVKPGATRYAEYSLENA